MFKIPRFTPFIKDALGPRRLSQIWKIWYVLICLSMESDLRTLWAQWLSPKHPQRLCKVCWSTVLLLKDLVIAMSMNEHLSGKTKFSMASCNCISILETTNSSFASLSHKATTSLSLHRNILTGNFSDFIFESISPIHHHFRLGHQRT